MKIQCNVCHVSEAAVFCCADEAALCLLCDHHVHDANKLASKHQRFPISTSSSHIRNCDICKEAPGHFLCLEDRSLLCRMCDAAVHSVNSFVSAHNRFLFPGVKLNPEDTKKAPSSGQGKPSAFPKNTHPVPLTAQYTKDLPVKGALGGEFSSTMSPITGSSSAVNTQPWHIDNLLLLGDCSEADKGKLGSSFLTAADEEFKRNRYMGLVADSFCNVPNIHSPINKPPMQNVRQQHDGSTRMKRDQ